MSDISNRWVQVNKTVVKETSYVDKEVAEGTTYQYRVIAENKAGKSKPSEPSQMAKAKEAVGKFQMPSCLNFLHLVVMSLVENDKE